MTANNGKLYTALYALLLLVAFLNLALTLYSCSAFYIFLPTSDTWIHTSFLAQAAQGQMDVAAMFVKHNGVHLIALPMLVYFFDMWLTNGSGVLVTCVSLIAMLLTAAIFSRVVFRINTISKAEKIFLGVSSAIFLTAACQVESLLNPANLQWSLLVFSATFTAWFYYRVTQTKSAANITGVVVGIILVSLTSASPFLILVPLGALIFDKKKLVSATLVLLGLILVTMVVVRWFFHDQFPLATELSKNWLKFTVDFLIPPVERLHSIIATAFAGILVCAGLYKLAKNNRPLEAPETIFFTLLLSFSLFVIFTTGIVRSYSPAAFTFRFVNVGLLFAATVLPLLFLQLRHEKVSRYTVISIMTVYIGLLSYINIIEVSKFGFGRAHIRLTQVAHALDINDSFVVASMPGTVWEKIDFDYVQANKHLLKEVGTGIYGSKEYKQVGKSITTLTGLNKIVCNNHIIKMRRLLPEQASYRLLGESKSENGSAISRAYFVDDASIIRGFAIPVEADRNILSNLFGGKQWAGFVNLELSKDQQSIMLYAYSNAGICQREKIDLPNYKDLRKKSVRSADRTGIN